MLKFLLSLALFITGISAYAYDYDIVVVGGSASGTTAAVQAARDGAKVLLVEEHVWLGGMLTAAGVSATDGCYRLRGGIWAEFRDSLEAHYGGSEALKTGWVSNNMFEPSVGARIFAGMVAGERSLQVVYGAKTGEYEKTDNGWKLKLYPAEHGYRKTCGIPCLQKSRKITCKILVDATELGDVAEAVGVTYDLGMDCRSVTGEPYAPVNANKVIQDITYVMILKDYGRSVPMECPAGYDPSEFACCCDNSLCVVPSDGKTLWSPEMMMTYGKLPGGKYMINWPLSGNDIYMDIIEMSDEERESALERAKAKSMRFLYFIKHELGYDRLYLADDEYPTEDRLPFIPYHRESRRIHGKVRFRLQDILAPHAQERPLYKTSIAVGDYPVDQHHNEYDGSEELPELGLSDCPIPSYGVPMGVMIPAEIRDMLVIEKSISVTNLVNGTTRLQPVVLQLGQAAGVLAALAVKEGVSVDEVSVRKVQDRLLNAGSYLLPVLDLPVDDPAFKAVQRVLASGVMLYEGKNEGWSNESWFGKDEEVDYEKMIQRLANIYLTGISDEPEKISAVKELIDLLRQYEEEGKMMTRLECAVLVDEMIDPFEAEVNLEGNRI